MKPDRGFSDLVGLIYEGALERRPWQGFLLALRDTMGAVAATLMLRPEGTERVGLILNEGGSSEGLAVYKDGLFMADPFVDLPPGQVVALHELVPLEDFEKTELYRLCMAPGGMYDSLGADVVIENGPEACLRIARSRDARPFTRAEKELCAALLPHLERAIRIYIQLNRMQTERALFAGAIEQLAVGAIILDDEGSVIGTNALADQILAQRDGLFVSEGTLRLGAAREARELKRILGELLEARRNGQPGVVQALRIGRSGGRADLGLIARPVPAGDTVLGGAPTVVLFVSDPEQRPDARAQVLMKLFGFTPTESQLAIHLANGMNIDDAAAELGMSRNTARAHLRAVFGKTGVSRQSALVSLILKSVAALG